MKITMDFDKCYEFEFIDGSVHKLQIKPPTRTQDFYWFDLTKSKELNGLPSYKSMQEVEC